MEAINYGGWLTEDLEDFLKQLMKQREHTEDYCDRVDINLIAREIREELQKRKND